MCRLCNNSDPSWVRKDNRGHAPVQAIEEACNIVIQYTEMYPCKKARQVIAKSLICNSYKSIDDVIIDKLFKSYDTKNQRHVLTRENFSRTATNDIYEKKAITRTFASKMIQQVVNRITNKKTFMLRITRKNLKVIKQFNTLEKAIFYREEILNTA